MEDTSKTAKIERDAIVSEKELRENGWTPVHERGSISVMLFASDQVWKDETDSRHLHWHKKPEENTGRITFISRHI